MLSEASPSVVGTSRPSPAQIFTAITLSLVAFAITITLRASGQFYGVWVIAVLGLLLMLIPVSKHFSGRILWTLSVVFGFVPLLWWIPISWPHNSRSSLLLAVLMGVAVFTVVWFASSSGGGARRLLPGFRTMDCIPIAAAVGAIFIFLPSLMVRRVQDAMALLLMSWDNASHFDIYNMQRIHGTVVPLIDTSSDGARWSFSDYPQGFHSALVMLSELARPMRAGAWEAEVVTFANFTAIMNVAIIVLVVAAVCTLPSLRKAPAIGVPVAVFVGSGWIFGTGALASMHGFSNFLFTTAMVVAAIVLCQSMVRVFDPIPLIAVGACFSAVMQNWVLLGVFLIPSVLAVLFVTPKGRWKATRRELVVACAVLTLVAIAAATAASQLLTVKATGILFATGGVPALDYGLLVAFLGLLAGAAVFLRDRKTRGNPDLRRTNWSLGTVWVGLAVAASMGIAQVTKTGALSYYMQKFSIALALIVLVGIALAVSGLLTSRNLRLQVPSSPRYQRIVAVSVLASLGLTQVFGFVLPLEDMGMPPTAEAGAQLQKQRTALEQGSAAADRILQAVRRSSELKGPVMYLTTNQNDVDVILAQQWFDGLRGNYTEHNWNLSLNMFPLSEGAENLREVITAIRAEDPSAQIVVDPENQDALDKTLAELR